MTKIDKDKKALVSKTGASLPSTLDPLQYYLNQISQIPLIDKEREQKLAKKVFHEKDVLAAQELAKANLRFVVKLAFEYARYGAKVMDLIQEGNLGLVQAIREFDPYKDVRLTTYAVWWIRSYMQDYLLRHYSMVKIGTTKAQKKLFYNLKKEQAKLERDGFYPSPKALAMKLDVSEDDVTQMQERMAGGDVSLSRPIGKDKSDKPITLEEAMADTAPLASNTLIETEQKELFHKALQEFEAELNEREVYILKNRLLDPEGKCTLQDIGTTFNITKERARQLEDRIKEKLRQFLSKKYPDISLD